MRLSHFGLGRFGCDLPVRTASIAHGIDLKVGPELGDMTDMQVRDLHNDLLESQNESRRSRWHTCP